MLNARNPLNHAVLKQLGNLTIEAIAKRDHLDASNPRDVISHFLEHFDAVFAVEDGEYSTSTPTPSSEKRLHQIKYLQSLVDGNQINADLAVFAILGKIDEVIFAVAAADPVEDNRIAAWEAILYLFQLGVFSTDTLTRHTNDLIQERLTGQGNSVGSSYEDSYEISPRVRYTIEKISAWMMPAKTMSIHDYNLKRGLTPFSTL